MSVLCPNMLRNHLISSPSCVTGITLVDSLCGGDDLALATPAAETLGREPPRNVPSACVLMRSVCFDAALSGATCKVCHCYYGFYHRKRRSNSCQKYLLLICVLVFSYKKINRTFNRCNYFAQCSSIFRNAAYRFWLEHTNL